MFLRFLGFLLIFLLAGKQVFAARVNLFLNISEKYEKNLSFKIKRIYLFSQKGQEISFQINKKIEASRPFGQYFLVSQKIPPGKYHQLKLVLEGNKIKKLPLDFSIRADESLCLFLIWHLKASLDHPEEAPVLSARPQRRPLGEDTVYVSCEDLDTVFAIRTDLNQVQASVGVPGDPKDLVLHQQRLFVLSAKNRSIYLVETSSFRIRDRIFLPLVIEPTYLLVLPDNSAVVTDPRGQYLIRLDLTSGELLGSKRLGRQPLELFFDPGENLLLVSSPLDQVVFGLTPDLSLVKRLAVQSPRGLLVTQGRLYVAEYNPGLVGIFSFPGGQKIYEMRSGRGCVHLYLVGKRIFISNQKEGTISILRLGQKSISKKIRVGGTPFSLISCARRRWLYVANRKKQSLTVIDLTSEKMMGEVELGGVPFGLSGTENSQGESRCWPPNCSAFTSPSF